jgi:hypothetical protein
MGRSSWQRGHREDGKKIESAHTDIRQFGVTLGSAVGPWSPEEKEKKNRNISFYGKIGRPGR